MGTPCCFNGINDREDRKRKPSDLSQDIRNHFFNAIHKMSLLMTMMLSFATIVMESHVIGPDMVPK